ncbi:MAG: SRPBCC family protein [Meiothermus sp.]|nr:SRPBCC family protein [Meiothermus sp.]
MEHTLESTWVLRAPLAPVWAALADPLCWPQWWLDIQSVQVVQPGQTSGVEAVYRLNGQELRVCEVRPLELLEGHTDSVLARCTLEHEEGHTFVHWSVWGYPDEARFAQAMLAGASGLAEYLGVRLLEVGSWNAATDQSIFP